jgi:hypothetical protein
LSVCDLFSSLLIQGVPGRVRDIVQAGEFNITYNGDVYVALPDSLGASSGGGDGGGYNPVDPTNRGSSILPVVAGKCL